MIDAPFPHDRGLRGMDCAIEPDSAKQLIQKHILEAAGWRATSCTIGRLRYRRGKRAVLQYALTAYDAHGREHAPIVSALMFAEAGLAARAAQKLAAGARHPSCDLPVSAYDPETDIAFQIFPHDRKLPGLARLFGDPRDAVAQLPPRLVTLQLGEAPQLCLTRYRAGLSATMRIDCAGQRHYAKVYPNDQGERTDAFLRELETDPQQLRESERIGVRFNTSAGYAHKLSMLALKPVGGVELLGEITSGAGSDALGTTAPFLAAFNQSRLRMPRTHTAADESRSLRRACEHLGWVLPELRERMTRLVDAACAAIDCRAPAPTHRDLKPDHIFLDAAGITLIDLDSCAASDPLLDPALLIARLCALPFILGRAAPAVPNLGELPAVFEAAYLAHVPLAWRARLRPLVGGAIVDVSMGFFGRQEAGWRDTVRCLLEIAERHVGGAR